MFPMIISGANHTDKRGSVRYNNNFDASLVKRLYTIENINNDYIRCWQGHKVEQRWFSAIVGRFVIELIKVDNWVKPSRKLKKIAFEICNKNADILHVPAGYISSIRPMTEPSVLLAMSDYRLNEIQDDYKFSSNYFNKLKQ